MQNSKWNYFCASAFTFFSIFFGLIAIVQAIQSASTYGIFVYATMSAYFAAYAKYLSLKIITRKSMQPEHNSSTKGL